MAWETVGYALIAAVVYSLSFYLKSGEEFKLPKLLATALTGVIIGCLAMVGNVDAITEQWVVTQLMNYAALTALIETWIKAIVRKTK